MEIRVSRKTTYPWDLYGSQVKQFGNVMEVLFENVVQVLTVYNVTLLYYT